LIVCGALDAKYCAIGAEMAERIPESRLEIVEGSGHAVHLEAPERFASLVGEFVASLAGP
jgi:pimeloyl-ACP methyl ester carboxylesterase